MGLMDFFKRRNNKIPRLAAGKLEEEKQQDEEKANMDVQVFSRRRGNNGIEYSFVLSNKKKDILLGRAYSEPNEPDDKSIRKSNIEFKNIAKKVKEALSPMTEAKNEYSMNQAKKAAIEKIQEMARREDLTLTTDVMQYIEQYERPNVANLDDKRKQSRMAQDLALARLDILNTIDTPEKAYENKGLLITCMKEKERAPLNAIVEASVQSIQEGKLLDDDTVIKIAQNMEEEVPNEDGKMYPALLKLEEARIWRKIQEILKEYSTVAENKDEIKAIYELAKAIGENYELPNMQDGLSPAILDYMIHEMREDNIVNYIKNIKENDILLARSINAKCPDIQDKAQILQFLYARIGSLGQLSCKSKSNDNTVLRNFIANTDFKHKDDTEIKEFLFQVANIEREYIRTKYGLEEKDKSFKERIKPEKVPVYNIAYKQNHDSIPAVKQATIEEDTDRTA